MYLIRMASGDFVQFFGLEDILPGLMKDGCRVFKFDPIHHRYLEYKDGDWVFVMFLDRRSSKRDKDSGTEGDGATGKRA